MQKMMMKNKIYRKIYFYFKKIIFCVIIHFTIKKGDNIMEVKNEIQIKEVLPKEQQKKYKLG